MEYDAGGENRTVMRARRRGGARGLRAETVRVQPLGPGEVRIGVRVAGVAFGDLALLEGLVPGSGSTVVPGYDVVGRVTEVSDGSTGLSVGDDVVAWTGGSGGYATEVVLPAWQVVRTGDGLEPEVVDALVLNYMTAYQMLWRTAPLQAGSVVLVHAAAGGVGSALVQLARLRGLRVLGTVSTPKVAFVREMGAVPIDYRTEDVARRVREEAPSGVDAVFDALGPTSWRRSMPLLRAGGRLVVYGVTEGFKNGRLSLPALARAFVAAPRVSPITLFSRGRGVEGYASGPMFTEHHDWYREDLTSLLGLLREGAIHPAVHRVRPLRDARAALEELAGGGVTGKIVLRVAD